MSEAGLAISTSRGVKLPQPGDVIQLSVVIRPDVVVSARALVAHADPEGRIGVVFSGLSSVDAIILREYSSGRGTL